jgi:hypothetical protein
MGGPPADERPTTFVFLCTFRVRHSNGRDIRLLTHLSAADPVGKYVDAFSVWSPLSTQIRPTEHHQSSFGAPKFVFSATK